MENFVIISTRKEGRSLSINKSHGPIFQNNAIGWIVNETLKFMLEMAFFMMLKCI